MSDDDEQDRDALIEQVAGAHRFHDGHGRVLSHAAWADLDDAGRIEAFERGSGLRRLEQAIDPDGCSTTARVVLARIQAASE